jgi:hypothetical protein
MRSFAPRSLLVAFVALYGCGPSTSTQTADAATDAPTDRCRTASDLAPPPPGCRFIDVDPCTGIGTLVCPDAGADVPASDVPAADVPTADVPATDVAPSDVSPTDATADAAISCSGGGAASFPVFSSACNTAADCVVAVHQTDCCGNQRGLGLNASQRAAFDAAEAVCRPMYPRCGCPTRGILCDDERWTFGADMIGVDCRAGRCTTFVR